jgi:hypothetical protein
MGVPTSEVGYTAAMSRREDNEVHKDMWWHWTNKNYFLNLGARWKWVVNVTPRPLYPRERSGTHCIGGWVVRRASLDGCGKSRLHRQPVASRYTGRAIPADDIDRRMGMLQQPNNVTLGWNLNTFNSGLKELKVCRCNVD